MIDEIGVKEVEVKIVQYVICDEYGQEMLENVCILLEELYGVFEWLQCVVKFVVEYWEEC